MDCILEKDLIFAIIRSEGMIEIDINLELYHPYFFNIEKKSNNDGNTYYIYLKKGSRLCDLELDGNIYSFELLNGNRYKISNLLISNNITELVYLK